MIISSKNIVYNLGTQIYTTLKVDFQPEKITDIQIVHFEILENSDKVGVIFKWEPARDETCKYDFIIHDPTSDEDGHAGFEVFTQNYPNIYHFYKEIEFEREISVTIRGINEYKNDDNSIERKESNVSWVELEIPTCMEVYNDRLMCEKPEKIIELNSTMKNIGYFLYNLNVQWKKPLHNPDTYTLEIFDINAEHNANKIEAPQPKSSYSYEIDGIETSFKAENLEMTGHYYYIKLHAHLGNKTTSTSAHFLGVENKFKKHNLIVPLVILILASAITIIMVAILIFNQYQIKEKLNENMDLDLIKSISNRSVLEAIDELTKDESMEIDRDNIKILGALGEGAFGYVKKGIVIKNDVKLEVAVKMLKSKKLRRSKFIMKRFFITHKISHLFRQLQS